MLIFCGSELRRFICQFHSGASAGEAKIDRTRRRTESHRDFPVVQGYNNLRRSRRSVTLPFPLILPLLTHSPSVYFLKRAQILVAETWAAFFPLPSPNQIPHPIFPGGGIHKLTMFADYRVPQILHHLKVLTYPPSLLALLESGHYFEHGSKEEVSIRAASIIAVDPLL